jgi:hypothetical protein
MRSLEFRPGLHDKLRDAATASGHVHQVMVHRLQGGWSSTAARTLLAIRKSVLCTLALIVWSFSSGVTAVSDLRQLWGHHHDEYRADSIFIVNSSFCP